MAVRAYYNENDPFAAAWLRELIAEGVIAPGDVDERDIRDVKSSDLSGYAQHHFFAGIGGWSYALRLAGWPDERACWTGSCPCQPFSAAGKGAGFVDERHLWPDWFWLVSQCRPAVLFGEQVDAGVRTGWLDLVFSDLETLGYTCGATVLPAASVGAPHRRDRLWFVAHGTGAGLEGAAGSRLQGRGDGPSASGFVGNADQPRPQGRGERRDGARQRTAGPSGMDSVAYPNDDGSLDGLNAEDGRAAATVAQRGGSFWSDAIWLPCTDGKARPAQPGIFPLAHGIPNRVGTLRGAGNAIVAQAAAAFVRAYLDAC